MESQGKKRKRIKEEAVEEERKKSREIKRDGRVFVDSSLASIRMNSRAWRECFDTACIIARWECSSLTRNIVGPAICFARGTLDPGWRLAHGRGFPSLMSRAAHFQDMSVRRGMQMWRRFRPLLFLVDEKIWFRGQHEIKSEFPAHFQRVSCSQCSSGEECQMKITF